jgi:hypothetical protein
MNARNLTLAVAAALTVLFLNSVGQAGEPCAQPQACATPCDAEPSCCPPTRCAPDRFVFADFLYLRPRNDGIEYAVPTNLIAPRDVVQAGRTATLNPQFQPGFRIGGGVAFDSCSTISAAFTHYENSISDEIHGTQTVPLRSMVAVPATESTANIYQDAYARQFLRFDLVDADYRHVFYCTDRTTIDYLIGFRYANLRQSFASQFGTGDIEETVDTLVNFDGAGIRFGIEGERSAECCNLFLYGKAAASFLGGEFQANYVQARAAEPLPTAQTDWTEARLVSILECEIGVGWAGCNGHVRASAGYMISGWLNTVKTSEFIESVRANQFHGKDRVDGNALVFDGLVSRVEFLW